MGSNRKDTFDIVYQTYRDDVLQVAKLCTRNLHTAEDITQEVFLKYHLYTATQEVRNHRRWLLTLSRNLSLNYIRDNSKETVMDLNMHANDLPDWKSDPANIFFEKLWKGTSVSHAEVIMCALKEKNIRWFDAITLVYGMARKRKDVADAMGITEDALDGLLKRAKNWIETNYRKEYDHINCK